MSENKMRILVVTQYFYPETFRINDIVLGLKEKGHEVTVLTGKPNYPSGKFNDGYSMFNRSKEIWNSVPVYRSALIPRGNSRAINLILNYLSFAFFASIKAWFLNIKADVIFVYQLSPITAAVPAIVLKNKTKAKMVLYIQDLWPQSVIASNGLKNGLIIKQLEKLTSWIYKNSDKILIQSRAFKDYLINEKVDAGKISYLPNSTESFYKKIDNQDKKHLSDQINIVFAGNIGEAQSFDTLVKAARLVKDVDQSITWTIIGDGRKKAEVEKWVKQYDIEDVFKFLGSFKPEMMPQFFSGADALLVSLKKDFIFSLTIPSKLQSYMACAKPIIGSLDGEGKAIIHEADCGLTAAAEDPEQLAIIVLKFKDLPETEREILGNNALAYFQKEFDRSMLLDKLIDMFKLATEL